MRDRHLFAEPTETRPRSARTGRLGSVPILQPGANCCCVARADRATVLVDGAAYFAHLEAALRLARRSIFIIGWDFDGRIRLRPECSPELSPPLGPFLRALVEEQPELTIRILVWSVAVVHAPSAPGPLLLGANWQNHPRLQFRLDRHHPLYAAQHQKMVCVDDSLAFVGGIDLTIRRWDTSRHAADDPFRLRDDGSTYDPVHDTQMLVAGPVARKLANLARCRWKVATGETVAAIGNTGKPPWPPGLAPDFVDTAAAIARTFPAWGGYPPVLEAAALTCDALSAAKRTIYIEAQYMTAPSVGGVLERHLANPDGPEIIVIQTRVSHGLAERLVMGANRDRLIRRLRKADPFDRLRVYYPVVPTRDGGERQVLIHSKLIVVDDVFLRVGSSNLNNRSIGLDTECDLAVEGTRDETRRTIVDLRNRLVAEHLDASPAIVAETIDSEGGSVIRAIERLNTRERGLRAFKAMSDNGPARPALGTWLLDPPKTFQPLWFLSPYRG